MLASHNILNPANGAPITVPSQDMVLGPLLYDQRKKKHSRETLLKVKGKDSILPKKY
jgi:DNA-directed RNA polymerase beta' subunit